MDGLQWKTLLKWMIWGENPLFSETSHLGKRNVSFKSTFFKGIFLRSPGEYGRPPLPLKGVPSGY